MFDRNTIIALVVVGVILLLLKPYYEWISPPQPPAETVVDTLRTETTPELTAETFHPVEQSEQAEILAEPEETVPTESPLKDGDPLRDGEYVEKLVEVETPLFNMTIGSNGMITDYELKDYTLVDGLPVRLTRNRSKLAGPIGYLDFNLGKHNFSSLQELRFDASTPRLFVPSGSDSIIFEAGDMNDEYVRLVYVIHAQRYGFDVGLQTSGLTATEDGEFNVKWMGGVPSTEPDPNSDHTFSGAFAQMGGELEEIQLGGDEKKEFAATGVTNYIAVRSKYFIAAIIPQEQGAGADLLGRNPEPKVPTSPHVYNASLRQPWPAMGAGGYWQVYWGPITVDNLKEYNVGLENTMNWGWAIIKPFSRFVLWALTMMHNYIPNYGIVIILFSIFVKIVLWPLTRKSQISMKKMSALQPEIKALKELHAKNPQAANQATMKLYKERGVNPAAGCIPILFQMPVLYGLFIVFRSTIEFRQAPFIGWITDLSLPDVIFDLGFSIPLYGSGVALLPIVMGVSQFFMSKKTMTDPNQKAMIYIMPVFMT
ncbi:membrane protein insertase YidC, partial [bacterium]|nr:membrane protein insertase YidC [bacterium]